MAKLKPGRNLLRAQVATEGLQRMAKMEQWAMVRPTRMV